MRALILTASLAVVVLGGVSVVAWMTLRDAQEYIVETDRELRTLRQEFDALDATIPAPPAGPLTAPRLDVYSKVRQAVAETYAAREKIGGTDTHRNTRTRVEVLKTLRIELEQSKMSAREYEAVEFRVLGVLAAVADGGKEAEVAQLYGEWLAQSAISGDLRPHEAVKGATPEETKLVTDRASALRASLPGMWASAFLRELIRTN